MVFGVIVLLVSAHSAWSHTGILLAVLTYLLCSQVILTSLPGSLLDFFGSRKGSIAYHLD